MDVVTDMRLGLLALVLGAACAPTRPASPVAEVQKRIARSDNKVFQGALAQLVKPAVYDAGYRRLTFPNGDVPADRGACADVVVRALRHAGIDLQAAIHRDAKRTHYANITRPDTNIDHRRVLNQETWLKRHAKSLTLSTARPSDWKPGDIVSWRLERGQHIGIVSDLKRPDGLPYVIHNIGVVAEEDVLTAWPIVGHFRLG